MAACKCYDWIGIPRGENDHTLIVSDIRKNMVLTALGPGNNGVTEGLIRAVEKRGCEIVECRIHPAGQHLAATLVLAGNWSALGKLESALGHLARHLNLDISAQHTDAPRPAPDYCEYSAEVTAPQHGRLLGELLRFFRSQEVHVVEVAARAYNSMHTGAGMCSVQLSLHVPLAQHPQSLRESFMDLCDDLHADGLLDPVKF